MVLEVDRERLEHAAALVHAAIPATPQLSWPLLNQRAGCEFWVKRENHTATGAFKILGGIVMLDALKRGNSRDKNAAMKAWGAELVEFGRDFDEAKNPAGQLAREHGLVSVGPYHPELIAGAAPLAALLTDSAGKGARFTVIASGGNIARDAYLSALGEQ